MYLKSKGTFQLGQIDPVAASIAATFAFVGSEQRADTAMEHCTSTAEQISSLRRVYLSRIEQQRLRSAAPCRIDRCPVNSDKSPPRIRHIRH